DFRIIIAGEAAAVFLVDQLPEAVEEAAFAIFDAGREQRVADAERGEFAHRMRQQRDADAKRFPLARALVNTAGDAARLEIERQCHPADSAADNRNLHRLSLICRRMEGIAKSLSTWPFGGRFFEEAESG